MFNVYKNSRTDGDKGGCLDVQQGRKGGGDGRQTETDVYFDG
jgi:hypothetical protein